MKRLLAIMLFLLSVPSASAAVSFTDTIVSLNETVSEDVYAAGQTVSMNAPVLGDVVAAGVDVSIDSPVQGDVIAAGRSVTISAPVTDDVRVAGQTITINDTIGDHISIAAQTVVIGKNAVISGDAWISAETVRIDGSIKGDLTLEVEELQMNGRVEGMATMTVTSKLTIDQQARFESDVHLTSYTTIDYGQIIGELTYTPIEEGVKSSVAARQALVSFSVATLLWLLVYKVLLTLVVGVVLLLVMRVFLYRVASEAKDHIWLSMGIGAGALVLSPLAMILLLMTLVLIPFAFLLGSLYAVLLIFGTMLGGFIVGHMVLSIKKTSGFWWMLLSFLVGTVIVELVMLIPIIGALLVFLLYLVAMGAIVRVLANFVSRLRKAKAL